MIISVIASIVSIVIRWAQYNIIRTARRWLWRPNYTIIFYFSINLIFFLSFLRQ